MKFTNLAIIGAGNMGASLLHGILAKGYPSHKITVSDPSSEKLQPFAALNIHTTTDNEDAIKDAQVILFAVKPALLSSVISTLTKKIQLQKPLLISIAAGVREKSIAHWVGDNISIVRAMPNTPAMIGCGATALFANQNVTTDEKNIAENLLRSVGVTIWLENEDLMDAATALSGSGPAYFFFVIEALQKGGQALGLPADVAKILSLQTAYGASRMALESHESVAELRKNVTSPEGTTEAAIKVLQKENLLKIFQEALKAADTRAAELAEIMDKKD